MCIFALSLTPQKIKKDFNDNTLAAIDDQKQWRKLEPKPCCPMPMWVISPPLRGTYPWFTG